MFILVVYSAVAVSSCSGGFSLWALQEGHSGGLVSELKLT